MIFHYGCFVWTPAIIPVNFTSFQCAALFKESTKLIFSNRVVQVLDFQPGPFWVWFSEILPSTTTIVIPLLIKPVGRFSATPIFFELVIGFPIVFILLSGESLVLLILTTSWSVLPVFSSSARSFYEFWVVISYFFLNLIIKAYLGIHSYKYLDSKNWQKIRNNNPEFVKRSRGGGKNWKNRSGGR